VVAGAIAKQFLALKNIQIQAYTHAVGNITMEDIPAILNAESIEKSMVRCPDALIGERMEEKIKAVRDLGDSIGGVVACRISHVPVGLGDPVYERLEANLAKAMLSINATKGFEIGSGFMGSRMHGSEHNDEWYMEGERFLTKTNNSGGIQGGISNGMPIEFKVAFKPVATLMKDQQSVDNEGKDVTVKGKGRHDPCVVPRAVPIVEAMAAMVLLDHLLINNSLNFS
jgi:chorismate synthase